MTSTNKKNFTAVLVESDYILNFKDWWPRFYKKTMLSVESVGRRIPKNEKVLFKISQFMHFTHSYEHDGVVLAKNFIDGFVNNTFRLRNPSREKLTLPTAKAYTSDGIPINKKKMKNLLEFKTYLPDREDIQEFYNIIYQWPVTDAENEVEVLD